MCFNIYNGIIIIFRLLCRFNKTLCRAARAFACNQTHFIVIGTENIWKCCSCCCEIMVAYCAYSSYFLSSPPFSFGACQPLSLCFNSFAIFLFPSKSLCGCLYSYMKNVRDTCVTAYISIFSFMFSQPRMCVTDFFRQQQHKKS